MGATIVAPATGPSPGGIGIVRISGPLALELGRNAVRGLPEQVDPRRAYFVELVDSAGGLIDQGLFIFFQAPASFTGEDVVELHAHGSPRLLALVVEQLLRDGRARLAEPGEFTRRAFLNGRIDLSRAEAVADLVAADSEAAVRAAAAQLSGAISARVRQLREPLLELRTDLEGVLNFPEEAEGADEGMAERLAALTEDARRMLADAGRGALLRTGAKVVLFGPVNAGKSTLFNRLVGAERAIVDEEPGTTRDVLEARLELSGLPVTLVDTAGLRAEPGRIEAMGIARAREALAQADLAVLVVAPEASDEEISTWADEAERVPLLIVRSKQDLSPAPAGQLQVSGATGAGVDALRALLVERLWGEGTPGAVAMVSERHADALRRAAEALERAQEAASHSTLEVVSGELGLAIEALGEITGESAGAELIDSIFRRFCIGK